ncbi:MAG: biotin carboxyl carrier domain-containing protein [Gammaproteobacteria bacterium]|nr:MAG: biotin carboxyl carrier domain-containing protein [Gammaproteobacteria bacterium]RLA60582.1 MAG: biotin carboxyl carrier domain-containing protein [Gammaproteobacteria bacterium]
MTTILSPLPGTFYIRVNPESEPFKKAGDAVSVGDTIGLVEVMKTFIEIKAEVDGTFVEYSAKDTEPVTAGQNLAELEG